ncbi:MAG TPA: DUF2339 domain-containing protein, partial [Methylomirabilota bacterium]|nr:DUF2339 domain-containing protein [Methylomirabilota bacterium]
VMLFVAAKFEQVLVTAAGLGGVLALELVWFNRWFSPTQSPTLALTWLLVFAGLFLAHPFVARRRYEGSTLPWAMAALSLPAHFPLIHRVVKQTWPNDFMGLLPAALALPVIAGLITIARWFPAGHEQRNRLLAWFGGAALLFITLVFPIQFDRQWITLGWALEGLALCWWFRRVPQPGLRLVGVALLCIAFARLALNPAVLGYQPRSATAIFNWYLYAYGTVVAALFVGARLLAPPRDRIGALPAPALLNTLGTLLAFLLVNIEIADYFTPPGQAVLAFQFSGDFARDMTYTIAWALFALGLVVAGMRWHLKSARYAGLALLGVTLLKLFFHDLGRLAQLYRIGALAAVAVIAILASFLYQRFLSSDEKPNDRPS